MSIYCTYLTTYRGNKLPPFYIGSTSVEKISKGYHGSVSSTAYKNLWKSEQKEHPELFLTQIITKHSSRFAATEKEISFLKRLKVVHSPMYINLSDGTKFRYEGDVSVKTRKKQSMQKRKRDISNPPPKWNVEQKLKSKQQKDEMWKKSQHKRQLAFISKAEKIHLHTYTYKKVCYTNTNTTVIITCSKHGDFYQSPAAHIKGARCPKCWHEIKCTLYNKNTQQFIQESKNIHGDKYLYEHTVYCNTKTPVCIYM